MLIIKRFFRKRHNKVYILICTVILSSLMLFNAYIKNIQAMLDSYSTNHSYLIMLTKNDVKKKILKSKDVYSVDNSFIIAAPDGEKTDIFTHQGYEVENANGTTSSNEAEKGKLYWEDFEASNRLLITYDESLKDREAIFSTIYDLDEEIVKNTLNKKASLIINDKSYEFKVKNVEKSTFPQIIIAKEMYDLLCQDKDTYTYIIRFKNETALNKFYDECNAKFSPIYRNASIESNSDYNNYEELISLFRDWKYIIYVILMIILFVIISNMLADENKDINLDYILGFSKRKIKINNLMVFLIFSFIVSFLSICINCIIIKLFANINLTLNINDIIKYIIVLFVFIIINIAFRKIKINI